MSQTDLAGRIGVSYAQLSRYEIKGAQPTAEVLNKLADVLDTSVDFLINGDNSEKSLSSLKDTEVLKQFKEIDNLPEEEKNIILKVIRAYLWDYKTRQAFTN